MLKYSVSGEEIISIQVIFYEVYYTDNVVKVKNYTLSELGANKELVNIPSKKANIGFNKLIPMSMDLTQYPNKLETKQTNNCTVEVLINGEWVDFASRINDKRSILNKDKIELKDVSMFSDPKNKFILSLNQSIVENKICHITDVYMPDGSESLKITDLQESNTSFNRIIGNISNTISNKQIILSSQINIKLDLIKPNKVFKSYQKNLISNDPFIGTLDTETYTNNQSNFSKVYALGFYTKKYGLETFYIGEDLDSDKVIIECFDRLLTNKYNNYTFYVHNLGNFDIAFFLKVLVKANINTNKYDLDPNFRDSKTVLSLTIVLNNNSKIKVRLLDSYNILSSSLSKLCETFKTKQVKGYFPYSFVTNNTLFYSGEKPLIEYYKIEQKDYDLISVDN
jgi:hypothetical protein